MIHTCWFRSFWIPVLLSDVLKVLDIIPLVLRLLDGPPQDGPDLEDLGHEQQRPTGEVGRLVGRDLEEALRKRGDTLGVEVGLHGLEEDR
jgi:hypothetical protein